MIENVYEEYMHSTDNKCCRVDIDGLNYNFKGVTELPNCECKWHNDLYLSYPNVYKILRKMFDESAYKKYFLIRTDCFVTYSGLKVTKKDRGYKKIPRHQFGNFLVIPYFGVSLNVQKSRLPGDNAFDFLMIVRDTICARDDTNVVVPPFWNTFKDETIKKAYIDYFQAYKSFRQFLEYNKLEGYEKHFECCSSSSKTFKNDFLSHTQELIYKRTLILGNP